MKQVLLQRAYVLHRRPYRETSFLVELFTPEYGRLTAVAKGAHKPRSTTPGLLQPFVPLLVSWVGRGELMTLTHIEIDGDIKRLQGECMFAGLYLNELLMCLLQKWEAYAQVYTLYAATLAALEGSQLQQKTLRAFEKGLLEELGYGLLPKSDHALQNAFLPEKYYRFVPEMGFIISELGDVTQAKASIFSGQSLLAIAKEEWHTEEVLRDAKRLARFLLAPLLGSREVYSRKLFLKLEAEPSGT